MDPFRDGTGRTSTDRHEADPLRIYLVAEFPAAGGRGFRFAKVSGHTNPTAASEDVFIGTGRRFCSCRGFSRTGDCKHVEAVVAILENNWLPAPVCQPAPKKPYVAKDPRADLGCGIRGLDGF